MDNPSHVLFVDIWMPTTDKYYLETKDGRTTTYNREIIAQYESNYREDLLRAVQYIIKTNDSIKNLSLMRNKELTPNVLNRILEAMPTVEYGGPAELAIDTEWFDDVPSDLKRAFKEKIKGHLSYDEIKGNLSYVQAHCIMQLTGKAGQKLRALTGSSFKGDQDALVISNTGSGKTEALLLTLLTVILENKRLIDRQRPSEVHVATPIALVLVPTRTLAEQIFETLIDTIGIPTGLKAVSI